MSDIKLLNTLAGFDKPYFSMADFEKILGMERDSLYVTLNRLVEKGILIRLKRDVYVSRFQSLEFERIANQLCYPSYLSFESALSRLGIMSQIPYNLTFATTKPTKKISLGEKVVEYRKLKEDCFFGYALENGVFVAEPEKALLDQLYMLSKGKAESDINEWSLVGLKRDTFLQYSKRFPKTVQRNAKRLVGRFGKHVVTLN